MRLHRYLGLCMWPCLGVLGRSGHDILHESRTMEYNPNISWSVLTQGFPYAGGRVKSICKDPKPHYRGSMSQICFVLFYTTYVISGKETTTVNKCDNILWSLTYVRFDNLITQEGDTVKLVESDHIQEQMWSFNTRSTTQSSFMQSNHYKIPLV